MVVQELAPGLWRWTAPHPAWTEGSDWPREVGSVYYEAPEEIVLFDPQLPTDRAAFLAALDRDVERVGRPVTVVLTVDWHRRSTSAFVERYEGRLTSSPDSLPRGMEAFPVASFDELLLWLSGPKALVAGDTLLGTPAGIRRCPASWLAEGGEQAYLDSLQPVLDLPIELVLPAHGEPVLENGRDALAAALSARPWGEEISASNCGRRGRPRASPPGARRSHLADP